MARLRTFGCFCDQSKAGILSSLGPVVFSFVCPLCMKCLDQGLDCIDGFLKAPCYVFLVCDCWCVKGSPLRIVFVNAGKLVTVKGTVVWLLMSQGQSTTHRVCECRQAGDGERHSGVTVDVSRAVHYTSCLWMQASWWRWKAQWCVWVVSSRCVLTWRMSASVANTSRLLVACLPLL